MINNNKLSQDTLEQERTVLHVQPPTGLPAPLTAYFLTAHSSKSVSRISVKFTQVQITFESDACWQHHGAHQISHLTRHQAKLLTKLI